MTAICTKCKQEVDVDGFYKLANGKRQPACKTCHNKAASEWNQSNRERHRELASHWRAANPDKVAASNRAAYQKYKPERLAAGRKWAAENRDKCRASEKKWRQKPASKEISRLKAQRLRAAYPERHAASERKWRQQHPDKICAFAKTRRARRKGAPVSDFTSNQWLAVQAAFDHRCAYCKRRHKGKLTQDHVVPLSKGGSHTASNIVPACQSCNSKKMTGPPLCPVQPLLLV